MYTQKPNRQSNQSEIISFPFSDQHNKSNKYFMNSSDMAMLSGLFIELNY